MVNLRNCGCTRYCWVRRSCTVAEKKEGSAGKNEDLTIEKEKEITTINFASWNLRHSLEACSVIFLTNSLMSSGFPYAIRWPSFSVFSERFDSSASCFSFQSGKLVMGVTRTHFWSRGKPGMKRDSPFASSFT